jgi:hypothetical protein
LMFSKVVPVAIGVLAGIVSGKGCGLVTHV